MWRRSISSESSFESSLCMRAGIRPLPRTRAGGVDDACVTAEHRVVPRVAGGTSRR
jgi:hypothetical protein